MKQFLAPILLLILLFLTFATGETMDDLVERDGIHYKKFSDTPFTGKITGHTQGSFKSGRRHGPWFSYFDNGQLWDKRNYKDNAATAAFMFGYVVAGLLIIVVNIALVISADLHKERGNRFAREAKVGSKS